MIMQATPGDFWEVKGIKGLYIDPDLKDLVSRMLTRDMAKRYGMIAVRGRKEKLARNDEVRNHPFMHGKVDWTGMRHRLTVVSHTGRFSSRAWTDHTPSLRMSRTTFQTFQSGFRRGLYHGTKDSLV